MNGFYDAATKKNLHDAKSRIQAITTVYNMELSNLSQSELIYADVVTKYSQLLIMEVMEAGCVQDGMTNKHKNHANQELLRYVSDKYHINIPEENIEIAIEGARQRSMRVFMIIERYKQAIKDAYLSFDTRLRYCSNNAGMSELNHVVKENLYMNTIVDGIYASSAYENMMASMCKYVTGGVVNKDGILLYPTNPFSINQTGKTKIQLKSPMYIYSVSAYDFTPSVCLELIHGSRQDGSDIYFPDLRFDDEWISKEKKLECDCEEIDYIPTSLLKTYQVIYNKGKAKVDYKGVPRQEYIKNVSELVKKGKLVSVNEEFGINATI